MRQLRFRAWDFADEMMYYDVQFGISFDDGSNYPFEKFLGNQDEGDYHEWDVMQFTGLTDKNGVEIYEGDMLGGYPHATVFVMWDNNGACFVTRDINNIDDPDGDTLLCNDLKDCPEWEVIGNIHQK